MCKGNKILYFRNKDTEPHIIVCETMTCRNLIPYDKVESLVVIIDYHEYIMHICIPVMNELPTNLFCL